MKRAAVTPTLSSPTIDVGEASLMAGGAPGPETSSPAELPRRRVFVAEGHPLVLQAMREVLADQPDLSLVGEASTEKALFVSGALAESDVLIVDLSLGRELVERALARFPGLVVVAHSILPRDPFEGAALKAGAAAFVSKGEHPAALLEAIRQRPSS